jgi:mandelate racemase
MSPVPAIAEVRARSVLVPLSRPLRTASGSIPAAPLVLLDVRTDAEVVGHAYLFGYTAEVLAPMVALVEKIAPSLVGQSLVPVQRMRDFEARFRLLGMQGLLGMAVAGIDMALWDALGKVFNQPVATLLGGAPVALRAYDSYGMVDPRKDEAALRKSVAAGFPGIKIKLGYPDPSDDVAVVRGVRGIIGSDAELMVDFNQSLDPPEACRRIQRLQEFDLYWVEEPVAAEDLAGHAQVRRITGCRVQTGENWWFPRGLGAAISASACDFAMLDIMKIGGVTGWMRAAGQAQAASLPVSSHLFVEASAHTLAVTPTADWLEYLDIAGPVLADRCHPVDGYVTAVGPGLGITWNEAAIAEFAA